MKNFIRVTSVIALVALAGCSLGKRPNTVIYKLTAPERQEKTAMAPVTGCAAKPNIQVVEPVSGPGLESRRIAVTKDNQMFDYYAGVRWASPPSQMLQVRLVEGLEQSKAFGSVSSDMESVKADVVLLSDMRHYEVDKGNVRVQISSKLVDAVTRHVLATIPVEKNLKPEADKIESIIAAFNKATNEAVSEIASKAAQNLPACKTAKSVVKTK